MSNEGPSGQEDRSSLSLPSLLKQLVGYYYCDSGDKETIDKVNECHKEVTRRLENVKEVKSIFDIVLLVLGIAVIILSVIRVELSWNETTGDYRDTHVTEIIGYTMLTLCIVSLILVILSTEWRARLTSISVLYPIHIGQYLTMGFNAIIFLIELAIAIIHPFFWVSPGNFWLLFCTLFKVYPCLEVMKRGSKVVKKRTLILDLFKLFAVSFPRFDGSMVLRLFVNRQAILFFLVLVLVMLAVFGYLFFISERPSMNGRSYWASVYWAAITSATVGYGDITPTKSNQFSMFLACVMAILGACVVAMTIGLIISKTTLAPNEKAMLEIANALRAKERMRDAASMVVLKFLQLRSYEKKRRESERKLARGQGSRGSQSKRLKHDVMERDLHKDLVDAIYRFTKLQWEVKNRYTLEFSMDIGDMALQMKNVSETHANAVSYMKHLSGTASENMQEMLREIQEFFNDGQDGNTPPPPNNS